MSLVKFQLGVTRRKVCYGIDIKIKVEIKEEEFSHHMKITVGRIDVNEISKIKGNEI